MVIFLAVTVFGRYLFPLPGTVLAWREWLSTKTDVAQNGWRRIATAASLFLLTAAIPLWGYAAVRELRDNYSYVFASAQFGRWYSLVLVAISAFALSKTRRYLLLGALGILFFFSITIGELP